MFCVQWVHSKMIKAQIGFDEDDPPRQKLKPALQ